MANSRIKDMSTVTPAAATFLALDSVSTGTGKAAVGDVVGAGLAAGALANSTALDFNGVLVEGVGSLTVEGAAAFGDDVALVGFNATATGDMGGHPITSLSDPTSAQDAATKAYVDKGGTVTVSAVVTTTDATPTTALTIAVPTNTAIQCTVRGVFGKTSHVDSGSGTVSFGALNNGGTLALSGAVYNDALEASGTLTTAVIEADSSGSNLLIIVTGVLATTIRWYVVANVVSVSLA